MERSLTNTTMSVSEKQAFSLLRFGFTIAPVVAGADKFLNYLTHWTKYLAPVFPQMLHVTPQTFMEGVGIIEIIAGIGVALKPRIFGYVVCAWLVGIIVNLVIVGGYWDIALRDLGLAIGSFALARLSADYDVATDRNNVMVRGTTDTTSGLQY